MRKLSLFVFALLVSFILASPAFALLCKNSNYGESDECWTNARLNPNFTNPVSAGSVMVYDFSQDTAGEVAWYVVPSSAAGTNNYVAGVIQKDTVTGDTAMLLVRGKGIIRAEGGFSSGDPLFVNAPTRTTFTNRGVASRGASMDATSIASHDKAIAFALESQTTVASATADAYIIVL